PSVHASAAQLGTQAGQQGTALRHTRPAAGPGRTPRRLCLPPPLSTLLGPLPHPRARRNASQRGPPRKVLPCRRRPHMTRIFSPEGTLSAADQSRAILFSPEGTLSAADPSRAILSSPEG